MCVDISLALVAAASFLCFWLNSTAGRLICCTGAGFEFHRLFLAKPASENGQQRAHGQGEEQQHGGLHEPVWQHL
ncbi:hypothetical protein VU06_03950, partial [Desulfobulbus sp. F3]|nr:hypothetical protein [Desulfobulbus sp. F3]